MSCGDGEGGVLGDGSLEGSESPSGPDVAGGGPDEVVEEEPFGDGHHDSFSAAARKASRPLRRTAFPVGCRGFLGVGSGFGSGRGLGS